MKLTDRQIKTAEIKPKSYKLTDGKGLFLLVEPSGSKKGRYKYSYLGKEKQLGLGIYPVVGLADARQERQKLRDLLDDNIDPSVERQNKKRLAKFNADNSFEAVAKEWHETNMNKWSAEHARKLWRRLELHILPLLGKRAVAEISTLELLDALRKIEKDDKTETSHRALQTCKLVFQYAVLTQKVKYNPANDLNGVLKAHKTTNYPTLGHNQLPEFLEKLEVIKTSDLTKLAIKALILTMVRQGELRRAMWSDIDFGAKEWRVRPETTKMRTLHHVPLSAQAIKVFKAIQKITGEGEYVFASQQKRKFPFMSENTINKVIHDMGYKGLLVGHGFRAMASTILNENGGFRADVIERQLAHMPRDKVRATYNRAEYLPERRQMMDWWGDFIDGVR
jgi:integrase